MSTSAPTLTPQVIGQTEKALNAILDRLLAGTGVTEPQWVTLNVAVMSGGAVERDELVGRVAGVLKVRESEAQKRVAELVRAQLLQATEDERALVELTDAGRQLHTGIRAATTEITLRLWGDLPAEELATTGRVLSTVLERANAELG